MRRGDPFECVSYVKADQTEREIDFPSLPSPTAILPSLHVYSMYIDKFCKFMENPITGLIATYFNIFPNLLIGVSPPKGDF